LISFKNTDLEFNKIIVNNAFFYIHPRNVKESLSNIFQCLKPGGRLLILDTPDYNKRSNWQKGRIHRLSSRLFGVFNAYMASFWVKKSHLEKLANQIGYQSFEIRDASANYRSAFIFMK